MPLTRVDITGVDTSALPMLKNDVTMDLLRRAHEGDNEARDRLIEGNLRLVLSVMKRFTQRCDQPDDLFQVGSMGLIKAIDNFDLSLGVRFSTYAVPMIIGEIRRYLRDNNPLRISRSLRDIAYKALRVKDTFAEEKHREPTMDELAQALEVSREEIVFAMEAIQEPVSLFEPIFSDSGDSIYIMDSIRDEKDVDENWTSSLTLNQALSKLFARERRIIDMRFFEGRTQTEVAQEIGISQAQVSRLEKGALKRMKKDVKAF